MLKLLIFHLKNDFKDSKFIFLVIAIVEVTLFLINTLLARQILDLKMHSELMINMQIVIYILIVAVIDGLFIYLFFVAYDIYNKKIGPRYHVYNIIGLRNAYITIFSLIENVLLLLVSIIFGTILDYYLYFFTLNGASNSSEYFRYDTALIDKNIFLIGLGLTLIPFIIGFLISAKRFFLINRIGGNK